MKRLGVALIAAALGIALCSSGCASLLTAGQFDHDSITPPPLPVGMTNGGETAFLLRGSGASGTIFVNDQSGFVQVGVMRSWRASEGVCTFDGHAAASGWFGEGALNDKPYLKYSPSVEDPFAFYGGSAQLGLGLGVRFAPRFLLYNGTRIGAAYEAGPYRDFRSSATNVSDSSLAWGIANLSASGWSGYAAYENAAIVSLASGLDLRFGLMIGLTASDLQELLEDYYTTFKTILIQPSASVQFKGFYAALAADFDYLTYGLSASLGYVIKDKPRPGASSARPPTVIRPRTRE
jgi:hypothetical protein